MTRLADMGVEPYLVASSLLGVLAQRLVRTLCPVCRAASAPSAGEQKILATLGLPSTQQTWGAPGCDACNHTGFRGRTGVYELLLVDDTIRRGIHDGADELALRAAAERSGMTSLRRDGARWIADGSTSLADSCEFPGNERAARARASKGRRPRRRAIDTRRHVRLRVTQMTQRAEQA